MSRARSQLWEARRSVRACRFLLGSVAAYRKRILPYVSARGALPRALPQFSSHHFPQPSTTRNPFLVTSNLDRGFRQCAHGTMCVRLGNSSLMKDAATGLRQQGQGIANPLFREILDVSCLFPGFCGCSRPPFNCKRRRVNSLQAADKIRQSSAGGLSAANPLFQKILQVSGLFSIFCWHSCRVSIH
jgi:hypothetical protein